MLGERAMTRREVKRLEIRFPLPKTVNGKIKVYEEIFISSAGETDWAEAKRKLEKIREAHPEIHGWYCSGENCEGVFKENGKWYTYRYHGKYEDASVK